MHDSLREFIRLVIDACPSVFGKAEVEMQWQFWGSWIGPSLRYFDQDLNLCSGGGMNGFSLDKLNEIGAALGGFLRGPGFIDGRSVTHDGWLANALLIKLSADGECSMNWSFDREREITEFEKIKPYLNESELKQSLIDFEYFLEHKGFERRIDPTGSLASQAHAAARVGSSHTAAAEQSSERYSQGELFLAIFDEMKNVAPENWDRLVFDGSVIEGVDVNGQLGQEVSADFQVLTRDQRRTLLQVKNPMRILNALVLLHQSLLRDDGLRWNRLRLVQHRSNPGAVKCRFDPEGVWQGQD